MGLKRKNKVSAQFNMSSLTDIIFLLLIFFMLTSTIIAPNALNLKLPGRADSPPPAQTDQLSDVAVKSNGTYLYNRQPISKSQLEGELRKLSRRSPSARSFTISPDKQTPVENVVYVMDLAMRMNLNAVLLPEQ